MIRHLKCGLFVVLGMLVAPACDRDSPENQQEQPRKVLIGFIGKSQSNAVFQAAEAGALDAARELGAKFGVQVQVIVKTPVDENAAQQAERIEELTRLGVHGIAISCSEANTVTGPINRAVDAGIAVMCFDSDAPASKRLYYYGTDDAVCGQVVMAELARAMGGKGTIAILAGNQSAPNLQKRVAGVRAELKNHPGMKELNDGKGVFYHEETPEKAAQALNDAQRANPQIEGWALVGGWPLFTASALQWPAGSIKVVSVDALPQQLPYLASGHVEALYGQDCYGWGYQSVAMLLEKIVHGKDPQGLDSTSADEAKRRRIDPLTRVSRENAQEYGRKWEKWLKKPS
ncbi:MAG: substrate-binding domain-containing protein [Phycisphaerae bacterium]|nr:substrate-binding domain-containing protein [Phycisphaerae bacterium]MDW8260942.1 substrate-binding domain-containing protein [Phycisphaerales bacterium]